LIIDTHAHFVPPALLDDIKTQRRLFPSLKTREEKGQLCFSFAGAEMTRPVMPLLSDVDKRRDWMAEQFIDRQVVGGWLDSLGYELPAEEGADWSRFYNAHLLKGVNALPSLVPLATVPMQSGQHAATVLEEAMKAGFHGAMIGTQTGEPFFSKENLGVTDPRFFI
jgi:aminocarboxymuconate-semialdehyde decarboxylase